MIAYGPNIIQIWREIMPRQAAALLRGAKVADVPVEQPTKFELVERFQSSNHMGCPKWPHSVHGKSKMQLSGFMESVV